MYLIKKVIVLLSLATMLTACGRNMGSQVYTSSSASGKAVEGTVVSARAVKIKESDKLADNTTGAVMGGLGGAAIGNQFGSGSGNTAATVGVALAGAVAGAMAEEYLSTSDGFEYVVRLDSKKSANQKRKISKRSNASVSEDVQDSINVADTETNLITVLQGNDVVFHTGQRVYVIYSDDRPRLAPRY